MHFKLFRKFRNSSTYASKNLRLLTKVLGFKPGNISLYKLAFLHRSASREQNGRPLNNERLEYLGDAILSAVIADFLYARFPGMDEGFMSMMRARIVKRKQLNRIGLSVGLKNLIISNIGEGQNQKHIYGDALEALIGAIYLDKGYKKTRKYIIDRILLKYMNINELQKVETDYKSRIIEWAQKNKSEISFSNREEMIPGQNQMVFHSKILLSDRVIGTGKGKSKIDAEQKASGKALEKLTGQNQITSSE